MRGKERKKWWIILFEKMKDPGELEKVESIKDDNVVGKIVKKCGISYIGNPRGRLYIYIYIYIGRI